MKFIATVDKHAHRVEITGADGHYRVTIGDEVREVDGRLVRPGVYSLLIDGASYVADLVEGDTGVRVQVGDESYLVTVEDAARHVIRTRGAASGGHGARITAPLPGRITHVSVAPGDVVKPGDSLLVIEAMKMENEFKAGIAGTVTEVHVRTGQTVNAGDVLVVIA